MTNDSSIKVQSIEAQIAEVADLLQRAQIVLGDVRLGELAAQLDEPLYIVLMGEFNSGKSALVNALLGATASEEGVVPTTDRITLVRYGEPFPGGERVRSRDLVEVQVLSPLLELGICLIDTPGTNSVLERHGRLTEEFLHRAELVLFVISAERGFSQSEKEFLHRIRGRWDRKLVCALNKIDILEGRGAEVVSSFVRQGFEEHLDGVPEIFPISARRGGRARVAGDAEAFAQSGVAALETRIRSLVAGERRVQLKLDGALAACESILRERSMTTRDQRTAAQGERKKQVQGLARFERESERQLATLVARWRAAVDLAFVDEVEGRIANIGRLVPSRAGALEADPTGAGIGHRLGATMNELVLESQTTGQELLQELSQVGATEELAARGTLPVAVAAGASSTAAMETVPVAGRDLVGIVVPADERGAAERRVRLWGVGSGLTASGLATVGVMGVLHAPLAVLGAAGAGVVALWRRQVERGRLHHGLAERRDKVRLAGEEALLTASAAMRAQARQLSDPLVARASGLEAELSASLRVLDELTERCWELRQTAE